MNAIVTAAAAFALTGGVVAPVEPPPDDAVEETEDALEAAPHSAPPPAEAEQPADTEAATDVDEPPAELAEPAPAGKSVWATSEPEAPASDEPPPPDAYDPSVGIPPGGYWDPGQAPEAAPPDGEDERIAGYILVPLGSLTVASGAAMLYLTAPGHCQARTEGLGYNLDDDQCQGLLILNAIRVAYGSAAIITGAVLLAIGHRRKKALEDWKRKRFRASFAPSPGARGVAASAHFSIRF